MSNQPTDEQERVALEDTLRHWLAGHGCSPSDESMADLLEIVRTECRHAELAALSEQESNLQIKKGIKYE